MEDRKNELKLNPTVAQITGATAATASLVFISVQPSYAEGTVPDQVKTAIDNTIATINALAPVAIAAVAAALIPFGSSLALSFVHKIMSKM